MRYHILVLSLGVAQEFASALEGRAPHRSVYVVGTHHDYVPPASGHPYLLIEGDLDADTALRFHYTEAVGTDATASLDVLLSRAAERVKALQSGTAIK